MNKEDKVLKVIYRYWRYHCEHEDEMKSLKEAMLKATLDEDNGEASAEEIVVYKEDSEGNAYTEVYDREGMGRYIHMTNWSKVGKKSQRKGKRGQEEFAKWCRSHGFDYESCRRKDGNGLPGIHAEVKFYESREKLNVEVALNQAIDDVKKFKEAGEEKIPIVAWRVNYQRGWNITMKTIDFVKLFTGEPCQRELFTSIQIDGEGWMKIYKRFLEMEK